MHSLPELVSYSPLLGIIGDLVRVRATGPGLGELALIEDHDGPQSVARVVALDHEIVSLQVFRGSKGISTAARVRFLGRGPSVACSERLLGRVLDGAGLPIDGGPDLSLEPQVPAEVGVTVNPQRRVLPSRIIETGVPMVDLFNCLVESQKIPIFSVAGEPYNALLARIGFQAEADIVVFGGLGLIFDDYHFFRTQFEEHGTFHRTVMFVNQASDPIVERLLVPDMALAVAERFAVEEGQRVLVLLTDMTGYADALKELGIAAERIPATRGYLGDLYTQLAQRYEKACDFQGAGSVTILTVTTMPGDDVTHPVPDNTGYITEGQFYLHGGMIDPFGSLSRLKQRVIGKVTREDHGPLMNAMIRLYAEGIEAQKKQAMAFELSDHDLRLIRFAKLFRQRFMNVDVGMPLTKALDTGWQTLAECFAPHELLVKQSILDRYLPKTLAAATEGGP
ncbi:MAG: V-type ATP synthase subunit B [Myxococcales bacterium]|nr:V-type ATP synthase subunit B [Myxococcales bacterium]